MRQETIEKNLRREKARQEHQKELENMRLKINEIIEEFFEIISDKPPYYHRALFLSNNYFKFEAMLLIDGYSLPVLTEKLNEKGFVITEKTLKTELFRIRKRLGMESIRKRELKGEIPAVIHNWMERQKKIIEIFDTDDD